jgi:hypothetical protein
VVAEAVLGLVFVLAFTLPAAVGYFLVQASLGPEETMGSWARTAAIAYSEGQFFDSCLAPVWWSFLILFVTVTVAFFLSCGVRAAVGGVALEADMRVADDPAPRFAFKLPAQRLLHHAGQWFWPVFWLLNIYAVAVSVFVGLFFIGLAWLVLGILNGNWIQPAFGLLAAGILLFPASILLRLATFSATWRIIRFGDGVLDAIRNGWKRVRETAGHTAAGWVLAIAIGTVIGAVLSIPRVIVQFFIEDFAQQLGLFLFWISLTVLLQILAGAVTEVLQVAVLLSVWNGRTLPPVGFANQVTEPPALLLPVTTLATEPPVDTSELIPFPEALLPPFAGPTE